MNAMMPSTVLIEHGKGAAGKDIWSCGKPKVLGVEHPTFKVSITNAEHKKGNNDFCYFCSLLNGSLFTGIKNLQMLTRRMSLIHAGLLEYGGLNIEPSNRRDPRVALVIGNDSEVCHGDTEIVTTKSRLRFYCGDSAHTPKITSADNFFNRSKGKG